MESGAILMYLAKKTNKLLPQDDSGYWATLEWLMWQMANQGPKAGEAGHFKRLGDSEGDQSYAVRRFTDEVNRMLGVLNNRLFDRRYVAGDEYTIADMICYPWATRAEDLDQDFGEFKYLKRWLDEIAARPGVQRGMEVGSDLAVDYAALPDDERERLKKLLYNQRARVAPEGGRL